MTLVESYIRTRLTTTSMNVNCEVTCQTNYFRGLDCLLLSAHAHYKIELNRKKVNTCGVPAKDVFNIRGSRTFSTNNTLDKITLCIENEKKNSR